MASRYRDILDQILQLKNALDGFSFDELSISEAKALKQSFEKFRIKLEDAVWGNPLEIIKAQLELSDEQDTSNSQKLSRNAGLKNTHLGKIQDYLNDLLKSNMDPKEKEQLISIQDYIESISPAKSQIGPQDEIPFNNRREIKSTPHTFNPRQIIEQVNFICQTLITSDQLNLHFKIDQELPEILAGNGTHFYDLFMKLIGSRLSELSIGDLLINVYQKSIKNELLLNIELIEKIPDSSASRNASGREAATLSLIELSQTVDKVGGKFWLGNAYGNHSGIHLQIPIVEVKSMPSLATKPLKNKSVLVIDNKSNPKDTMISHLKSWGAKVKIHQNTLKALQVVQKERVDLVVLSLNLDGVDAFQACMRIRNSEAEAMRKTPVIAISDFLEKEKQSTARRVGINEVINSNMPAKELLKVLLNALGDTVSQHHKKTDSTSEASQMEAFWRSLLHEASGEIKLFEARIWMYRSDLITHLGALKIHLTLLDHTQIEEQCEKLDLILAQLHLGNWRAILKEFRSLNQAETGAKRMRELFKEMLMAYQKWDNSLENFLLKIRNKTRD